MKLHESLPTMIQPWSGLWIRSELIGTSCINGPGGPSFNMYWHNRISNTRLNIEEDVLTI